MSKVSAQQVYSLLSEHQLTGEQRAAIEEASITSPALVVAGAGSGKTELMTVRVLWLIANSIALPSQILGLTFTRKAAAELQSRIQAALYRMRESSLWPENLEFDFEPPKIATYNSFGNEIFRELSLVVGLESDAALIGEAASYQLVRELIQRHGYEINSGIMDWDKTLDYLTEAVINLASATTDHFRSAGEARAQFEAVASHLSSLPKNEKNAAGQFDYTLKYLESLKSNALAATLADAYLVQKRKKNLVDFSDQVALAVSALEEYGAGGIAQQYQFVMLDEYQDTSAIQTRMLASLFSGKAVMAVGDPNQAIYGWRGASSANLSSFLADFGGEQIFPLSTSWRSGQQIVAAANLIAEPLATPAAFEATGSLKPVLLAAAENAKPSEVFIQIKTDEVSEASSIAHWFSERMSPETSGAILVRTKSSMRLLASELTSLGLQVEITGLGGLLETPEVVDLVSALKVIQRPEAGTELLRVLSGAKYRLSIRDLAELSKLSRKLSRIREEVSSSQPITLVEALDELLKDSVAQMYAGSDEGLQRLKAAATLFRKMRAQTGLSLSAFAEAVAKELLLDIELLSIPNLKNPLGHLDEFYQRIEEFEIFSERPSLDAFLTWLDYAKDKERFEAPKSGSKKGVIQILTMHSSKGLEWDLVAIPQVVKNSFPNGNKETNGWLSFGQLPWNLRSDSTSLPNWNWSTAANQQELKKLHEAYKEEVAVRHLREETRLAYVAFTRAKRQLLVSASWFKRGGSTPREPSAFLTDLKPLATALELIEQAPDSNPLDSAVITQSWPAEPVANRAKQRTAAELVQSLASKENAGEYELLLHELEKNRTITPPPLPTRLSASAFSALFSDPEGFSSRIARPTPVGFSEQADTGNKFHATLEAAFRAGDEVDFAGFVEDKPDAKELTAAYTDSRFANLKPEYAEIEIQFPLAGFVMVCKLDAVYKTAHGYEVVDWKTGAAPKSESDLATKSIQLALYRIALSKYLKIGLEKIEATFFFVGERKELKPAKLISESEIEKFLEQIRRDRLI